MDLASVLVTLSCAHLAGALLVAADLHHRTRRTAPVDAALCFAVAGVCAVALGRDVGVAATVSLVGFVTVCLLARRAVDHTPAGIVVWASMVAIAVGLPIQVFSHLTELHVGAVTLVLLWTVTLLGVLRTVPSLVQTFEGWEVGLRSRWHAIAEPMTGWSPGEGAAMVTVQVPIHAEPPDVVIGTLDALSKLDYPRFEVLVIDNNTEDPALWQPVLRHCERLGDRFRFLHVEGITGAKAGALNWARPRLDPRTELVALVDADYQVHPDWLADVVGHFADPELGFVQCPHAYRDFEHSAYGRMANTAYAWSLATEMISRNEQGAGITIGTMCVIRLAAIDVAGGWAQWCVTEDSEVAIRIHAAGYRSTYLHRPYGWGLIPETFADLKKQRYRWTYGPGQEVKRHLRLYLPGRLRRPSSLTARQRWRRANYGLVVLTVGLRVLTLPVVGALLVTMAVRGEVPTVDAAMLLPPLLLLLARLTIRWSIFRTRIGATPAETLGGMVALLAMRLTVSTAGFDVLLGRPTLWNRTSKFRAAPSGGLRALRAAGAEIAVAAASLGAAGAAAAVLPFGGFTALLVVGFTGQALLQATAPMLSLLAENDLRDRSRRGRTTASSGRGG